MKEIKMTSHVSFRLPEEKWEAISRQGASSGETPNDWCRKAALEKLERIAQREIDMSPAERAIFEEVSRIRFLLGEGFYLLASDGLTLDDWNLVRKKAQEKVTEISRHLLSSAQTNRR